MTALHDYLAARAAFVDHDALVAETVDGLHWTLVTQLGDWRRVRFDTDPPGGFPPETTDRVIDTAWWPLGLESAEMIDARLAA